MVIFYFYLFLDKAKKLINGNNEEIIKEEKNSEMVENLDEFLEEDEIDRKK